MMKGYGYQTFDQSAFHDTIGFAMPTAHHVIQPSCQAAVLIAEMHRRSLLLPSVTVIEALVRRARQQADQLVHDVFAGSSTWRVRKTLWFCGFLCDSISSALIEGIAL